MAVIQATAGFKKVIRNYGCPVQQMNPNNIFSSKNVQKCSENRRSLKIKAGNFMRPLVIHHGRLFYHHFIILYLKLQSVENFCHNQPRYNLTFRVKSHFQNKISFSKLTPILKFIESCLNICLDIKAKKIKSF